jgi:hypothetical protein
MCRMTHEVQTQQSIMRHIGQKEQEVLLGQKDII